MAEIDFLSILLPAIVGGVISLVVLGIKKFGQTSEGTLTGTIRLEHVSAGMKDMEERIEKRFEKIDDSMRRIWEKLDKLNEGHQKNTWRLDRIENNRGHNTK